MNIIFHKYIIEIDSEGRLTDVVFSICDFLVLVFFQRKYKYEKGENSAYDLVRMVSVLQRKTV